MDNRMDGIVDRALEAVFGGLGTGVYVLNAVLGVAFIVAGLILGTMSRGAPAKKTAGNILLGLGAAGVLFALVRLVAA